MNLEALEPFIEQLVVAGLGGAAAAYAVFRFLGQKWIENMFAKNLEEAKIELSVYAARRMKLHDKEYELLPELWTLLIEAHSSLGKAVMTPPPADFSGMEEEKIEKWLKEAKLTENEKTYFKECPDKSLALKKVLETRHINDATGHLTNFSTSFRRNSIFLSPEARAKFKQIDEALSDSWLKKFMWNRHGDNFSEFANQEAKEVFERNIIPLMNEIEYLIQKRLFPEGKTAKAKEA